MSNIIIETKTIKNFICEKTGRSIDCVTICEGWHITSPAGHTYDLLEGYNLDGDTTSDIVFIFETNENGYKRLVQYFFGADVPDALDIAIDYIKDFEAGQMFDLAKSF